MYKHCQRYSSIASCMKVTKMQRSYTTYDYICICVCVCGIGFIVVGIKDTTIGGGGTFTIGTFFIFPIAPSYSAFPASPFLHFALLPSVFCCP
jgi:hypothetical protein